MIQLVMLTGREREGEREREREREREKEREREREREREIERERQTDKHISILFVLPCVSQLALSYKLGDAHTITHHTRTIVPDTRAISIDD